MEALPAQKKLCETLCEFVLPILFSILRVLSCLQDLPLTCMPLLAGCLRFILAHFLLFSPLFIILYASLSLSNCFTAYVTGSRRRLPLHSCYVHSIISLLLPSFSLCRSSSVLANLPVYGRNVVLARSSAYVRASRLQALLGRGPRQGPAGRPHTKFLIGIHSSMPCVNFNFPYHFFAFLFSLSCLS